jgi:hypothetical protein
MRKEVREEKGVGRDSPRSIKAKKITRKPGGGWGMISGLAASDSARSFLRRPIFSVWDSSLSPTLVCTQLRTTEVSASAVLAFLVVALVAAPVAVEPLLPMESFRGKGSVNGDGREE